VPTQLNALNVAEATMSVSALHILAAVIGKLQLPIAVNLKNTYRLVKETSLTIGNLVLHIVDVI